jgi:hypothetical protein
MRRIISDIFKTIQISWIVKVPSSKFGSGAYKAVSGKEKRRDNNLLQVVNKTSSIVTPGETQKRGDLSRLTDIYRKVFDTPKQKTSFSLASKPTEASSTIPCDRFFANIVLDEICACNDINDVDQDYVAAVDDRHSSIEFAGTKKSNVEESASNLLAVAATLTSHAEVSNYTNDNYLSSVSDSTNTHLLSAKCKILSTAVPLINLFNVPVLNQNFSLRSGQMVHPTKSARSLLIAPNDNLTNAQEV